MGIQRDDLDPEIRQYFPDFMFAGPRTSPAERYSVALPDSYPDALMVVRTLYRQLADHFEQTREEYDDLYARCDPDDGLMWRDDLREEMQWELEKARGGMQALYSDLEGKIAAFDEMSAQLRRRADDLTAEALEVTLEPAHPEGPTPQEQAAAYRERAAWLTRVAAAKQDGDFEQLAAELRPVYEQLNEWRGFRISYEERAATIRQFSVEERPEDFDREPDEDLA